MLPTFSEEENTDQGHEVTFRIQSGSVHATAGQSSVQQHQHYTWQLVRILVAPTWVWFHANDLGEQ